MQINPAQALAVFGNITAQSEQALFRLNALLVANGMPMYHYGGPSFNTLYRMYPTPQFLGQWRFPWLRLEQIYLSYLPEQPDQVDVVYTVSTDALLVVRHGS